MRTEAPVRPPDPPQVASRRFEDAPLRRLPAELCGAIVLLALGLCTFAPILLRSAVAPPPRPLDERIVVLPIPAPPPKPKPRPKPRPKQVIERSPVRPIRRARPLRRPLFKVAANVATADKVIPLVPPEIRTPPPSAPISNQDVLPGGNEMGAKAIFQPLLQIPDDLRQYALNVVAVARFHVALDGSATVELERATPNPELNALILGSLRQWRFFPALLDGKPVASTVEIRIPVMIQ